MIITVPERGAAHLSQKEWSALSNDRDFWRLVGADVVQAEAGRAGQWRIKGTCYVGRALIGSAVLEIVEKFPGSFEALVNLGDLKSPKITKAPSPVAKSAGSTAVLIALFIKAVRTYLAGFKRIAYGSIPDAGIIAGGRLDVARTIRLRAKGLAHQIAFQRSIISSDLPINRCIYAALREVERLSCTVAVARSDVTAARALRVALAECLPGVLNSRQGELEAVAAKEAAAPRTRPEVSTVISLAGALLNAAGFGGAHSWQRVVNRSWFVNLESLFEGAVRRTLKACVPPGLAVDSARRRPALFPFKAERYRANPDVVIYDPLHRAVAIGDAKYKDFTHWPIASDVHELLAHAAAFGAPKALLFYPDDVQFSVRSFGPSVTGCEVWAFGVTFADLISDVRRLLQIAGILEPRSH